MKFKLIIILILKVIFIISLNQMVLSFYYLSISEFGYKDLKLVYIVIFIAALILNWAILTKGILKKIIVSFIFFLIILTTALYIAEISGIESDYCIEDGDCKAGRTINTKYGKVFINKENCLQYNWRWNEKRNECKIIY